MTMVPIAETLDVMALEAILDLVGINALFVSVTATKNLLALKNKHKLKTLVALETFPADLNEKLTKAGFQVIQYKEVLEAGDAERQPIKEANPEDFFTLSFTSGTTGIPKAVMLNHFGITSTINSLYDSSLKLHFTDSHCSYLPLSHIFERLVMHALLVAGGEICFYGGDVLKLRDDWILYKPTIIPIVPRLINKSIFYLEFMV